MDIFFLGAAVKRELNPEQVTPGTSGFLAVLAMAVALIVLAVFMTRSIRKVRYQVRRDETAEGLSDSESG